MKKLLKWTAITVFSILVLVVVIVGFRTRERNEGYTLKLNLPEKNAVSGELRVGFATEKITPELPDTWTDVDGNAPFQPEKSHT